MRSLSEIETAVKRASKAVGFSWGNSEEVGKSIRQLELFGLQGIKNLNLQIFFFVYLHSIDLSFLFPETQTVPTDV